MGADFFENKHRACFPLIGRPSDLRSDFAHSRNSQPKFLADGENGVRHQQAAIVRHVPYADTEAGPVGPKRQRGKIDIVPFRTLDQTLKRKSTTHWSLPLGSNIFRLPSRV
jgi:hypothetical protein